MELHLANILTLTRFFLVPVFLVLFIKGFYPLAFFAFAIASFTDLIDGTVARMFKQHSQMGALLDPIADKLLMITTFSCLLYVRAIPAWFLFIVIARDVIVMGGIAALKILKIHVMYEPFWSSKFATLALIVLGAISLISLWDPTFQLGVYPLGDFAEGLVYITSVLMMVATLQYVQKGIATLQTNYAGNKVRKYRRKAVQRGVCPPDDTSGLPNSGENS